MEAPGGQGGHKTSIGRSTMAGDLPQDQQYRSWAFWVLITRMTLAVVITSAICSGGNWYWYGRAPTPGLTPQFTPLEGFVIGAVLHVAFGTLPATIATMIVVIVPRRTILVTVLAAVIPNAVGGFGAWAFALMWRMSLGMALLPAALGSVTFFLALLPWRALAVRCRRRA